MQTRNLRALAVKKNSAQQFWRERRIPRPVQSHFIFLVDLVARMSEALRELAVICENEQTFTLGIEPANVEEPGKFRRQQIENCVARVRIFWSKQNRPVCAK